MHILARTARNTIWGFLAVVLLAVATACGGSTSGSSSSTAATPVAKTTAQPTGTGVTSPASGKVIVSTVNYEHYYIVALPSGKEVEELKNFAPASPQMTVETPNGTLVANF